MYGGRGNKTQREEPAIVSERSLLAALIAGLILPPAVAAQTTWDCRPDPRGGWQCRAAGDEAETGAAAATAPPTSPAPPPPSTPPATGLPYAPAVREGVAPVVPDASATGAAGDETNAAAPYGPWALCAPRPVETLPSATLAGTEFTADRAEIDQGRLYTLSGGAVVERAGQRIRADRIRYDEALDEVQAEGGVRLDQSTLQVTGDSATLHLGNDTGELHGVRYFVHAQHARGRAEIARQESATIKSFERATYSTCDEDRERWRLRASRVTLDEAEGVGRARHARLELGPVPVLYTPYISFPIDDRRKSGLLVPSWGSSESSGAELTVPYYWNIAPHRDATITPRLMSKRGVQMQSEFRYLNPTNRGELGLEYLPSDSEFGDEDRSLFTIRHDGRPLPQLRTTVRADDVSDKYYFEDLGNSLEISSITHLERLAEATWFGQGWSLTGRVQDYQTVDRTIAEINQPYRRLPQLLLSMRPRSQPYGLDLTLDSEVVQFTHDHDLRDEGTRLDLQPKASLPLGGAAWFVTPSLGVRHTQYSLDDRATGLPTEPSRTTPIASLDSGLFFERDTRLFGNGLLQTLEPRAYYLYVPDKDQDELPVFDTGLRDFSFQQMFEDNRFSGADRMGDANQLTLAVTSRLLDPESGVQHLSVSVGEILYFRDREVTLPHRPVADQSASNLVGELDVRLTRSWKATAGMQWDPHESKTDRSSVRLQYRPDPRHLWNLSYRYRSGELEQIDTSALWHFTPRWHGVVRWNYSLPDRELLEGLAGIEYESCCWILRLMGRGYVHDTDGERNDAILVQLELKGLTSFGDPIEALLEDGILGYPRNQ